MKTYYHGTTSKALPTIAQMGLVPGKFAGADQAAMHTFLGQLLGPVPRRNPSVYLSESETRIAMFAGLVTGVFGGDPLYLKITVPAEVSQQLKEDDQEWEAVRCECVIKPEWIESYQIANSGWKKFDPQSLKELSA